MGEYELVEERDLGLAVDGRRRCLRWTLRKECSFPRRETRLAARESLTMWGDRGHPHMRQGGGLEQEYSSHGTVVCWEGEMILCKGGPKSRGSKEKEER